MFGRVSAVGMELAVGLLLGYFGGRWLDEKLSTAPWLMWTGLGLGFLAGFRGIYQLIKKAKSQLETTDPDDEAP
jgi:F0F1-type ATP synthase assembly protein I